jgi:hypothetical protein
MSNIVHGLRLTNAEHFRWLVTGRLPKPRFPKKGTRKPRRFPGICAFARAQGVDRIHAYRVLAGKRESRRLLVAWKQFKREGGAL